jgi:hypothetical protein
MGCAKVLDWQMPEDRGPMPSLAIPEDTSTPEQRRLIARTVKRIERISEKIGSPQEFRRIPVIVTPENPDSSHRWGYCQFNYDQNGLYIAISKHIFEYSQFLQARGTSDLLFQVLLHEFGHCYFGRPHDDTRLEIPNAVMELSWFSRSHQYETLTMDSIPASIMISGAEMDLPDALDTYYVGELLRIFRAQTAQDLSPFVTVQIHTSLH